MSLVALHRAVILGVLCTVGGCNGVQAALDPASNQARSIAGLWNLMVWICGFMYILVLSFLVAALWKAFTQRRAHPSTTHPSTNSEPALQRWLGAWTALIIIGLIVLVSATFLLERRTARAEIQDALVIKITGAQWWWKVEYHDSVPARRITTANELYLPVNQPVRLELHAEDVIHSLWIPNLAGKKDLIPGRVNTLSVMPTRIGTYRGQCAEFCGLQHANMAIEASVVTAAEFERWRARQLAPSAVPTTDEQRRGFEVFTRSACAACHQIVGTEAAGQTGPNLTHLASRGRLAAGALPNTAAALRKWLGDPQTVKAGNHMPRIGLAPQDLDSLVAYLESLR